MHKKTTNTLTNISNIRHENQKAVTLQ